MRRTLILGTVLLLVLLFVGCSEDPGETQNGQVQEEQAETDATEEGSQEETSEEDTTWDDVKNQDNIIGKSDKNFTELTDSDPTEVRNDTTGNWRKITLSDGSVNIEEYALSYHDLHMQEGEVHHIINFGNNTTTWLNNLGGLLYVDIKEYVDGEEHDASTLGNGMVLKSYVIYPDGDIEEIE